MQSSRLFPIGYDIFKALVTLVLILLLWWLWPKAPAPGLSAEVDPSGIVTFGGEAPKGKNVRLTITSSSGETLDRNVTADDGGRWLTAVELEPGDYTARAAIGSSASEPLGFTVPAPKPEQSAAPELDPVPSPARSPLNLSGSAQVGRELVIFLDEKPLPLDSPIKVGEDGKWSVHIDIPPGRHTVRVAYADDPEKTSEPLTLELQEDRSETTVTERSTGTASPPTGKSSTEESAAGHAYIVQEDDWLSKLAETYLGDPARYPEIRNATNAKAAQDDSFSIIEDDNLIYPGEKIWIPSP